MSSQKIPFNIPPKSTNELRYIGEAIENGKLSGDGVFSKRCTEWLKQNIGSEMAVITSSCTAALEMAMVLADIKPGDEVILPSYTFTSTATAPLLFGAVLVFVDIEPATMNINASLIEAAITTKTKMIIPVHYAGVACDMKTIMALAEKHNLIVVADAAQAIFSSYLNQPTGSWGHMAAYSFHETKNIVCGEGGALVINDERFKKRAEIVRDKGTNRQQFLNGQVDKYTWVDKGSSYLQSELATAFLFSQLEDGEAITDKRLNIWNVYHSELKSLEEAGKVERMSIPQDRLHNAHMYFVKLASRDVCKNLMLHLKEQGIQATTHYVPLHSSEAGTKYGKTSGAMIVTNDLPYRILRLPLYADLTLDQARSVTEQIKAFFKGAP